MIQPGSGLSDAHGSGVLRRRDDLDRIDLRDSTFSADLYFWMRYAPREDIASVDFPDLIRGKFDPEAPVSQEITDGLVHRLYRIKGEFKNDFKLQDYPFDAQRLTIRFANTRLTRDQVVYAVDSVGLRPSVTPKDILHRDPQMFKSPFDQNVLTIRSVEHHWLE